MIWTEISSTVTPARTYATAVTYKDSVVLFGGHDGSNALSDVWKFSVAEETWTKITATCTSGQPVQALYRHSAVAYKDQMIVFGGDLGATGTNNVWKLDLAKLISVDLCCLWTLATTGGSETPSMRYGHTAVVHETSMVIFSGGYGSKDNQLWFLDLETNSLMAK